MNADAMNIHSHVPRKTVDNFMIGCAKRVSSAYGNRNQSVSLYVMSRAEMFKATSMMLPGYLPGCSNVAMSMKIVITSQ